MESIIRNVKDIGPEERGWLETSIGQPLEDNQRVLIRVLSPGVEPDRATRHEAITRLLAISEKASQHREALGVSVDEADAIVDEAIEAVRSGRTQ